MSVEVADRLRGSLLGLALGDAVGAPFEGRRQVSRVEVQEWLDAGAQLTWTDDTHMALTLGEVLRDSDGYLDPERLGAAFAAAYAAEPWRGYGAGPPQVFALARQGMTYVEAAGSMFAGSGSFGNGAAMRVAPVALAAQGDEQRAADLAAVQAKVTHAHAEAVDGAVLVATVVCLLATSARHGTDGVGTAVEFATSRLPQGAVRRSVTDVAAAGRAGEDVRVLARRIGTGVAARESVPAAVAALLTADDVVGTVVAAVELGGDTDTIAAMAGAMAGAAYGSSAIPTRLLGRLEAVERLDQLASALLAAGPDA